MTETNAPVQVAMRIPGQWSEPHELFERLREFCELTPEGLVMPDETLVEFGAMQSDDQFADIFRNSCRRPPTREELAAVQEYNVNVLLCGPGGSMETARTMMQAGAAVVRSGGAGVFIDNCGLAHGGEHWLEMADDGSPEALSFGFVSIIGGKAEMWTMGMHVLGLRDVVMKRADVEENGFDIVEVIKYLCYSERPIEDGHVVADLEGPRFQVVVQECPERFSGSPMHNPFGRLKLVSMRDIAEKN